MDAPLAATLLLKWLSLPLKLLFSLWMAPTRLLLKMHPIIMTSLDLIINDRLDWEKKEEWSKVIFFEWSNETWALLKVVFWMNWSPPLKIKEGQASKVTPIIEIELPKKIIKNKRWRRDE